MELAPEALDLLIDYDWPGNVRELENVIERATVLTTGPRIGTDLIPDHVRKTPAFQIPEVTVPPEGISFKEVITDFEKRLIESTLEAAGGVQKRAAELLHIKPTTLNEMIKRYDIRPRRRRMGPEGEADSRQRPRAAASATAPRRCPRIARRRQLRRRQVAAQGGHRGSGDAIPRASAWHRPYRRRILASILSYFAMITSHR